MNTPDSNQAMYDRIDIVLASNKRDKAVVICMAVGIFILGGGIIAGSFAMQQPWFMAPAAIVEGFLYWPINKIIVIRRQNIALAAAPALIATLPPAEAAAEMVKLLENVRNGE
jgi:hypothetical protein